jgi:hypothetical protein
MSKAVSAELGERSQHGPLKVGEVRRERADPRRPLPARAVELDACELPRRTSGTTLPFGVSASAPVTHRPSLAQVAPDGDFTIDEEEQAFNTNITMAWCAPPPRLGRGALQDRSAP